VRRQTGILVHVHPVLPWNLKSQQPQLPRSEPDGQPTESSHLGPPETLQRRDVQVPRLLPAKLGIDSVGKRATSFKRSRNPVFFNDRKCFPLLSVSVVGVGLELPEVNGLDLHHCPSSDNKNRMAG
jgi:hypothetical protein